MGCENNWIPVGFRFRPTQQELLYVLQCKCQGSDITTLTNFVLDKNMYGEDKEPWKIFSEDHERWEAYDDSGKNDSKRRVLYVITKLSKIGAKKTSRTAGHGTWDGQTKPKPIKNYEGTQDIGWMRCLNYTLEAGHESEAAGKSYYYMHEYSLSDAVMREAGIASTDYVICRIVKDGSKRCIVKPAKPAGNNRKVKIQRVEVQEDDNLGLILLQQGEDCNDNVKECNLQQTDDVGIETNISDYNPLAMVPLISSDNKVNDNGYDQFDIGQWMSNPGENCNDNDKDCNFQITDHDGVGSKAAIETINIDYNPLDMGQLISSDNKVSNKGYDPFDVGQWMTNCNDNNRDCNSQKTDHDGVGSESSDTAIETINSDYTPLDMGQLISSDNKLSNKGYDPFDVGQWMTNLGANCNDIDKDCNLQKTGKDGVGFNAAIETKNNDHNPLISSDKKVSNKGYDPFDIGQWVSSESMEDLLSEENIFFPEDQIAEEEAFWKSCIA